MGQDFRKLAELRVILIAVLTTILTYVPFREKDLGALVPQHEWQIIVVLGFVLVMLAAIYFLTREGRFVRRLPSDWRGVCRGFEEATGNDRKIFQIGFIVLGVHNFFPAALSYLVIAAAMPERRDQEPLSRT